MTGVEVGSIGAFCAYLFKDIDNLERLVTKDPLLVNYRDPYGDTLLHYTSLGDLKVFNFLVSQDIDINTKNRYGRSVLNIIKNNSLEKHGCVWMVNPDILKNQVKMFEVMTKEYIMRINKIKVILKHLGLENIYYVLREIIEPEISDLELMGIVYG